MSGKLYRRRFLKLMTAAAGAAIFRNSLTPAALKGPPTARKLRLEDLDLSLMLE